MFKHVHAYQQHVCRLIRRGSGKRRLCHHSHVVEIRTVLLYKFTRGLSTDENLVEMTFVLKNDCPRRTRTKW